MISNLPTPPADKTPLAVRGAQGLLATGFGTLLSASYLLVEFGPADPTRRWLGQLAERVTSAEGKVAEAVQLALTFPGLRHLGLPDAATSGLGSEFREGMTTPRRQRVLGDLPGTASDPAHWLWGGTGDTLHGVLLLYAADNAALASLVARETTELTQTGGGRLIRQLSTVPFDNQVEQFGFTDGISQPVIPVPNQPAEGALPCGEFVLGYRDLTGFFPPSPTLPPDQDPLNLLPVAADGSGQKDFGWNGSYLVIRQLDQDVAGFWNYLREAAGQEPGAGPNEAVRLASKMVGRWPSGVPLVMAPDGDPGSVKDQNDFLYAGDPDGLRCPLGAHIRRANPRDRLHGPDMDSRDLVNRHRMIRRGRSYGPPAAADVYPPGLQPRPLQPVDDGAGGRGLHFLCLNADLGRQFEFVQQTWLKNPKFTGLYDETDPITGGRAAAPSTPAPPPASSFTVPESPVRRRLTRLPDFVTTRGGGYFFLPSLPAIRYLAANGGRPAGGG
jgi:Dyp-type peroxidase family